MISLAPRKLRHLPKQFVERVIDAYTMRVLGHSRAEIREKHGRIVLEAAEEL
jgi:hypothetical protein